MPSKGIFWVLSGILFAAALGGCAHVRDIQDSAASGADSMLLSEDPDLSAMPSFQALVNLKPEADKYEEMRIAYLLERMGKCPYNFVRNAKTYGQQRAAMHLRWKYFRRRDDIQTAEDFVSGIATRSSVTGQPYIIRKDEQNSYALASLLRNELNYLDKILYYHREAQLRMQQAAALKKSSAEADSSLAGKTISGGDETETNASESGE